MPVTGITIEADSVVVKGSDFDALCAATTERDELLKEVERLQRALHFWLPHVPATGAHEVLMRCGDDAMLLAGYDPTEPVEIDAEAHGWITLQVHPMGKP